MSRLKIYFFTLLIFLSNCKNISNREKRLITFDLKDLSKTTNVKLSDLGFTDIEYIPLETNEQCLISEINEFITGNDFFLIKYFNEILEFRSDGSFVTKIGREGRGPQEFQNAHDLDVDEKNQYIYIVSGWEHKFYVFSQNGGFIRTISSPRHTTEIKFADDYILCYSINTEGITENSFNLLNKEGLIEKSFRNKYPYNVRVNLIYFQHENLFYRFNNQLLKKEIYSDTVYIFKNKSFIPSFVLEHGEKLLTPKARGDFDPIDIMENYITQWNLFEFGDKVYYEFSIKGERYGFIGSKTNDFQVLTKQGFINDVDGGPNIKFQTTRDDSTVVSWINAIDLKTYIVSESFKTFNPKYPEKKKKLEKLANNLKENDNPVLMLIKLKE